MWRGASKGHHRRGEMSPWHDNCCLKQSQKKQWALVQTSLVSGENSLGFFRVQGLAIGSSGAINPQIRVT